MTIYLALTPTILAEAMTLWCGWRRDDDSSRIRIRHSNRGRHFGALHRTQKQPIREGKR